jgi:hypothetical protein
MTIVSTATHHILKYKLNNSTKTNVSQGAFFCRFPGFKGSGAEANLDGAEKNQEGITAAKPLQDGAEGADLDGVEKIRRELK